MLRNKLRLGVALLGILALSYGAGSASARAAENGGRFLCKITRPNGIVMVVDLFGYELKDAKAYQMDAYKEALADWQYGAREWADVVKEGKYPVPKPIEPDVKVLADLTGKDDKERAAIGDKYRVQLEDWNVCAVTDCHGNTSAQAVRSDYLFRVQIVQMSVYAKVAVAWAEAKAKAGEKAAGPAPQVPTMKTIKEGLKSLDEAQKAAAETNAQIAENLKRSGKPAPDPNPPSIIKAEQTQWPGLATVYTGADWGNDETYVTAIKEADYDASGCPDWKIDQCAKRGLDAYVFLWAHEAPTHPARHRYDDKVLCYYLGDRIPPGRWGFWAALEAQAYAGDPYHPTVFSMSPQAWGGIDVYFPIVRGRAIEYYHYHWDGNRAPQFHFFFLEQYRLHSALNGYAPIVRLTETRPEDMRKTSQTIFTSLAYGVRGFVYGGGLFDGNKRDERGVPTENAYGQATHKINKAIKAFSPVFKRARNVDVFQTPPLPAFTKEAPADYWVRPTGDEVVLGEFADRYSRYLVLANRDAFNAHEATLHFAEEGLKVSKMNKDTGEWQDLALKKAENGGYSVVVPMEEAGGELLRVAGHCVPPVISGPDQFIGKTTVRITCSDLNGTIHYTLDGSAPTKKSPAYEQPIQIKGSSKVRAIFVDKDGRASSIVEAAITKVEPKKADGKTLGPGVAYEYYEGAWPKLPAFEGLKPVATGVTKQVSLGPSPRTDNYALRFTGYIEITTPGSYTFTLGSDDSSRLIIDGETVLDIDGIHGVITQNKAVELKAGMHKVVVLFMQGGGGADLQLKCQGPDGKEMPLSFWCEQKEE